METKKKFPTRFVWDHGGENVCIAINGGTAIQLQAVEDGTFQVTTSLGQGRYEYCFSVDGAWTHDPDLPTIKNDQGHYSNLLKIVDAKEVVANKSFNTEKIEKCFSDATLNQILNRESIYSGRSSNSDIEECSDSEDFDDFPDLDDALDVDTPIFITESPPPLRKVKDPKISENAAAVHNPPRRQDTHENRISSPLMENTVCQSEIPPSEAAETHVHEETKAGLATGNNAEASVVHNQEMHNEIQREFVKVESMPAMKHNPVHVFETEMASYYEAENNFLEIIDTPSMERKPSMKYKIIAGDEEIAQKETDQNSSFTHEEQREAVIIEDLAPAYSVSTPEIPNKIYNTADNSLTEVSCIVLLAPEKETNLSDRETSSSKSRKSQEDDKITHTKAVLTNKSLKQETTEVDHLTQIKLTDANDKPLQEVKSKQENISESHSNEKHECFAPAVQVTYEVNMSDRKSDPAETVKRDLKNSAETSILVLPVTSSDTVTNKEDNAEADIVSNEADKDKESILDTDFVSEVNIQSISEAGATPLTESVSLLDHMMAVNVGQINSNAPSSSQSKIESIDPKLKKNTPNQTSKGVQGIEAECFVKPSIDDVATFTFVLTDTSTNLNTQENISSAVESDFAGRDGNNDARKKSVTPSSQKIETDHIFLLEKEKEHSAFSSQQKMNNENETEIAAFSSSTQIANYPIATRPASTNEVKQVLITSAVSTPDIMLEEEPKTKSSTIVEEKSKTEEPEEIETVKEIKVKEEGQISGSDVRGVYLQNIDINEMMSPAVDEMPTPAAEVKGDLLTLTPEVKEEARHLTVAHEEHIQKCELQDSTSSELDVNNIKTSSCQAGKDFVPPAEIKEEVPYIPNVEPKLQVKVTGIPSMEVDVKEATTTVADLRENITPAVSVNEALTERVKVGTPKEELSPELTCEPTPNSINGVLPSSSEVEHKTTLVTKEKTPVNNVEDLENDSPTTASLRIILDPSEEETNDTVEEAEKKYTRGSQILFEDQVGLEFIPEVDVVLASAAEMNLLVDLEVEDVLCIAAEVKELLTSSAEEPCILSCSSDKDTKKQPTPPATEETHPSSKESLAMCMLSPSIEIDNEEQHITPATEEAHPSNKETEATCIPSSSIELENKEQHIAQPTEETYISSKETEATSAISLSIENNLKGQPASPTQEQVYTSSKESSSLVLTDKETYNSIINKTNSAPKNDIKKENHISTLSNIGSELETNAATQPGTAPKRNATVLSEEFSSKQCSLQEASYGVQGSASSRDMFSQINNTLLSISKSKSNINLHLHELAKSTSSVQVQDLVQEDPEEVSYSTAEIQATPILLNENLVKKEIRKAQEPKNENLVKKETPKAPEPKMLTKDEILKKKRDEEREMIERRKMSKKLDDVFGVLRSEPVEKIRTEIKIRGMGDVSLDRKGPPKKSIVEHNKPDEYDLKKAARAQIAMPDKPATFKKPKPKPKEPSPKQKEESPQPVANPKAKKSCFMFIQKPTPQPKEKTPDLETKFWPTPKLPTPEPAPFRETTPPAPPVATSKAPLKLGINGFDRIGRLAFRAAFQAGLEVTAVNDPFIPLNYMVYSLKFDMSHCPWQNKKSDLTVAEDPNGNLIVNGKTVHVHKELEPSKIPWELSGVNYVIEATENLNSKVDAKHHLIPREGAVSMKDLVNKDKVEDEKDKDLIPNGGADTAHEGESRVKKVVLASSCPDAPTIGIGINEERLRGNLSVVGSVSAPANALILALKIIQEQFGLKFCAYTFIKAVMGVTREIKAPPMGPSGHSRKKQWDFSENLVPAPCPVLEEETFRFLPSMRGRLHGMVVYTPVPEVSMFDLTIGVERESRELYREVCQEMEEAAEGRLKGVLKYVTSLGDETSASSVFTGCPHSVVFDARSGCQIDRGTVKIVLWFDNEYGFANRIVDLVKKVYQLDCGE